MMTMSNALSAGQANTYYQQDYANKKENYYSERGEVNGNWIGRLAKEWGLTGEIHPRQIAQRSDESSNGRRLLGSRIHVGATIDQGSHEIEGGGTVDLMLVATAVVAISNFNRRP